MDFHSGFVEMDCGLPWTLFPSMVRGKFIAKHHFWSTASYKYVWPSQLILFAEYLEENKPPGPKMLELEHLPCTEIIAVVRIFFRKTHVSGCSAKITLSISTKLFRRLVRGMTGSMTMSKGTTFGMRTQPV
jgi:hypothetical protein